LPINNIKKQLKGIHHFYVSSSLFANQSSNHYKISNNNDLFHKWITFSKMRYSFLWNYS
jgi:hypothetical protein